MKSKIKLFIISILALLLAFSIIACDAGTTTSSKFNSSSVTSSSSSSSKLSSSSSSSKPSSSSSSKPASSSSSSEPASSSSSSKPDSSDSSQVQNCTLVLSMVGNGNLTATAGGKNVSSGASIEKGTSVTIKFSPAKEFKTTKLNISELGYVNTYDTTEEQSYTFTMSSDATVQVTFTQIDYAISISGNTDFGSVTADKSRAVSGASVKLTIKPQTNSVLTSLIVDGVEKVSSVSSNTFSFTMPSHNVNITYEFVKYYNITTGAVNNGTISVNKTSAIKGTEITVTAVPDKGYELLEITLSYKVNGQDKTQNLDLNGSSIKFTMPDSDVELTARFTKPDSRELVNYMILGDSYTDTAFWKDFISDFSSVKDAKDIGIGGTVVTQWITGLTSSFEHNNATQDIRIKDKYNVSNFVFHIGVNDIDGGTAKETVVANLKTLFTDYHNAYPQAQIYWVSLSLNTMFASQHTSDYLYVNAEIQKYMNGIDYLTYIDTCSKMFPDNQPVPDWFADGLHFNTDGYNTWSALILDALGYPKATVGDFGKADIYYSSNTFKANSDGTISNTGKVNGEQSLWFSELYEQNVYAEMNVKVNKITNEDEYPKFGLALKSKNNHVFFYIDAGSALTGKYAGLTYRTPVTLNGGFLASQYWNWSVGIGGNSTAVYTGGNYVKLGLLKVGSDLYFYVNDVIVNSVSNLTGMDGKSAIGLTVFNLDVTIKDYSTTTNVQSYIDAINTVASTRFDANSAYNIKGNNITNTTAGGESSAWATGVNHSKFYFETEITLNSVLNSDAAPKAGITVNLQGVGTLLFYIDAINTGSFGTNAWVGYVYRSSGTTEWNWAKANATYVRGLQYTSSKYAKLGLYKNGSRFIFTVNGNAVLDTSQFSQFTGQVNVGVMVFNLAYNAKNCGIVLSDKLLDRMFTTRNMADDIVVDGKLDDAKWSNYSSDSIYSSYATDGSGVGFKAMAFMGTNAIYVAYEITSKTYVTNNTQGWYLNFNVEISVPNSKGDQVQTYAVAYNVGHMVKSYAFISKKEGSVYKTVVEVAIPYISTETLTGKEASIKLGLACRPGSEVAIGINGGTDSDWWTGPNHAYNNPLTVNKNGIDASSIIK